MYENVTREELAKLFLPKNQSKLEKLTLEELNEVTKKILGCEVIKKHACMVKGNHSDMCCIYSKYFEFFRIYQDYANIFDFCKTMGVSHIYDIGNCFINQSFLLFDCPDIAYTGIDGGATLMDYRNVVDETYPNYHYPHTDTVESFCNGRISFVVGEYPSVELTYEKNNIAVAIYSLGTYPFMAGSGPSVEEITEGLRKDFDRVLMSIYCKDFREPFGCMDVWTSRMPEFTFYKVQFGAADLIYATKLPEDIEKPEKLKSDEAYRPKAGWIVRDPSIYDFRIPIRHEWEGHPTEKVICPECDRMVAESIEKAKAEGR